MPLPNITLNINLTVPEGIAKLAVSEILRQYSDLGEKIMAGITDVTNAVSAVATQVTALQKAQANATTAIANANADGNDAQLETLAANLNASAAALGAIAQALNTAAGANPVPVVSDINPDAFAITGSDLKLEVDGSDFVAGSVVNFDGAAVATTYVSATELTADIPAASLTAGSHVVTVVNPPAITSGTDGGTSNSETLTVTAAA
jgi:hypothetical protein